MNLTPHFTRDEFTRSDRAASIGLVNAPNNRQWSVIEGLSLHVLEHARAWCGAIEVTSGYRCQKLNELVGGAYGSDHQVLSTSAGVDIRAKYVSQARLFRFLWTETPWSRLIWYESRGPHVSWDKAGPPAGRVARRSIAGGEYPSMTFEDVVAL